MSTNISGRNKALLFFSPENWRCFLTEVNAVRENTAYAEYKRESLPRAYKVSKFTKLTPSPTFPIGVQFVGSIREDFGAHLLPREMPAETFIHSRPKRRRPPFSSIGAASTYLVANPIGSGGCGLLKILWVPLASSIKIIICSRA
jgi:hypothetical protein